MAQMAANITLHNASRAWCNEPGTQSHYCFPCRGKDYSSIFSLKSGALAWQYLTKMQKTAHVGKRIKRVRWEKVARKMGRKKKKRKEGKIKLLTPILSGYISTFGLPRTSLLENPQTWDIQLSSLQEAKKTTLI